MRPELLALKNFGPFWGETEHRANFAALGDFFLICGDTGAGKTTLFDAISYALYGVAPGVSKAEHLRSQYADEFAESYVRLTFSIGSSRYRIKRALPRDRITRTKTVKTDPEEVFLEQEQDNAWTVFAPGNKTETDKRILKLVGLSDYEFSRIVLLPQGEFSRFLKQDGDERRRILSKLFPVVSIYSSAAKKIKDKARTAEFAANEKKAQRNDLLAKFNPQNFEAEKQSLAENVAKLEKEGDAINKKIKDAQRLLDKAERIAAKQEQLKAAEESYQKDIAGHKEDCSAWQERVEAGNRAARIAGFIDAYRSARAELESKRVELERATVQLAKTQKEINLLAADREKAEGADGKRAVLVEQKTRIEDAVKAAEEYEESAAKIKSLDGQMAKDKDKLGATKAELAQNEASIKEKEGTCSSDVLMRLTQAKADADRDCDAAADKAKRTESYIKHRTSLEALQEKEKRAKEDVTRKEAAHKEAEDALEQARAALAAEEKLQKAAALALSLEEGAPCPVCGSVHHPAPAKESNESLEQLELAVKAAERQKTDADKSWHAATVAAERLEVELKNLSSQIEETEEEGAVFANSGEAKAALAAAKEKAASANRSLEDAQAALKEVNALKKNAEALKKQSEEIEKALQNAAQSLAGLTERSSSALERFKAVFPDQSPKRAAAARALADCEAELEKLEQFVKAFRQKDARLHSEKAVLEGSKQELESNVESLTAKATDAETKLKEKCAAAGFAAFEEAEAAVLPQDKEVALSAKIKEFESKKSELETQIKGLRQEIAAETADAPPSMDSKKLKNDYETLELAEQENKKRWQDASLKLSALDANHKRWQELEAECAKTEMEWTALSTLSDDLQGNNPRRIKFEAWILQQYLHEIVEYANRRIARLTTGQYELRAGDSFSTGITNKGLGLEVFDSYTGKTRPVATLSGGETFIVSISLALGLSDSIQNRNGGIQLESVFIDEGFGSLDDEHIDLAMNIFNEIRDHRMIGIISHIAELKERIPEKLEVKKKPSGGSCLKQGCA